MQTFIMRQDLNNTEAPDYPTFAFEAKDQKEADNKAFGWSQYHSFNHKDVAAIKAEENNTLAIHNEYVARW